MTLQRLKDVSKDQTIFWEMIYDPISFRKYENYQRVPTTEYSKTYGEHTYPDIGVKVYSYDRNRYLYVDDEFLQGITQIREEQLLDLLNNCRYNGRVNICKDKESFMIGW